MANTISSGVCGKAMTRRIVRTVDTTGITLTAEECAGEIIVNNRGAGAAVTIALPAALRGMAVLAMLLAAHELRLDPNGTETIALPSTGAQGAGGKYLVADAVGEWVKLVCIFDGTWDVQGYAGTWTAEA